MLFAADSFLVSPDAGLMIWTLIVFGISLYVLNKLAFPRIAEALDKRQAAIEDAIDTADRTRKEADELLREYRELVEFVESIQGRRHPTLSRGHAALVALVRPPPAGPRSGPVPSAPIASPSVLHKQAVGRIEPTLATMRGR